MLRRIELVSGLLVGVAGIILPWAVFLSGLEQRLDLHTLGPLVALSLPMLSAAGAAYLHSQHGSRAALALLWVSVVLQLGSVVLAILSIGVFLLPVALLSVIAATAGSVAEAGRDEHPG